MSFSIVSVLKDIEKKKICFVPDKNREAGLHYSNKICEPKAIEVKYLKSNDLL